MTLPSHPIPHPHLSPSSLPKSRTNSIPHNQLLTLPKATPKIPHALVQTRTKHTPHVTKHTLVLLDTESSPEEPHYRCKRRVCAQLENALS
jgi:hypothetical protein